MMGGLADLLKFEHSNLGSIWKRIQKDPERVFIGAIDSAGSKVWGEALGEDYSPMLDMGGGPAPGAYREAAAKGIDIDTGRGMHRIARGIAGLFAGSWAAGAMGGGGSAGAANTNATNPALIDSALGTPGYGSSSASSGGAASSLTAADWARLGQQFNGMGEDQKQQDIEEIDLAALSMDPEAGARQQMALSSRKAKQPSQSQGEPRGLTSRHPVDRNGAHIAAIQELSREVQQLQHRVAQAKARRRARTKKGK